MEPDLGDCPSFIIVLEFEADEFVAIVERGEFWW
jgi:hypothetical protein